MGFSLSWVCVRGSKSEKILNLLGLQETGAHEDFPESEITATETANGFLIVAQRDCLKLTSGKVLAELSILGDVTVCFVEEHVMHSLAGFWSKGKFVWAVSHVSGKEKNHLKADGNLPAVFSSISDDLISKQKKADAENGGPDYIFDIPVELAKSVAGYRYDEDISGHPKNSFKILERAKSKPVESSWLKKLFGS
jgi:hypothetical protein